MAFLWVNVMIIEIDFIAIYFHYVIGKLYILYIVF